MQFNDINVSLLIGDRAWLLIKQHTLQKDGSAEFRNC